MALENKFTNSDVLATYVAPSLVELGYSESVSKLDEPKNASAAVIKFKKDYNAKNPTATPLTADDTFDGPFLKALDYEVTAHRAMKSIKTAALYGAGATLLIGIGAYYMGKRSRSFAELTVGSYDSRISLPMYT